MKKIAMTAVTSKTDTNSVVFTLGLTICIYYRYSSQADLLIIIHLKIQACFVLICDYALVSCWIVDVLDSV
jgi:hypothetical protein